MLGIRLLNSIYATKCMLGIRLLNSIYATKCMLDILQISVSPFICVVVKSVPVAITLFKRSVNSVTQQTDQIISSKKQKHYR